MPPLEDFTILDGTLRYTDSGARYKIVPASPYKLSWYSLDNQRRSKSYIKGASSAEVPSDLTRSAEGDFIGCTLTDISQASKTVTVTFKKMADKWQLVGVDLTAIRSSADTRTGDGSL